MHSKVWFQKQNAKKEEKAEIVNFRDIQFAV